MVHKKFLNVGSLLLMDKLLKPNPNQIALLLIDCVFIF